MFFRSPDASRSSYKVSKINIYNFHELTSLSIQGYLRKCFPLNLNCKEDEQLSAHLLLSVVPWPLVCENFQTGLWFVLLASTLLT